MTNKMVAESDAVLNKKGARGEHRVGLCAPAARRTTTCSANRGRVGSGVREGGKTSFGAVCSVPADVSLAETIVPEIGPMCACVLRFGFTKKSKK